VKNYTDAGNILDPFIIRKYMDEGLAKRYLRLIYVKDPYSYRSSVIESTIMNGEYSKYYIRLINNLGAYYWANYKVSGHNKNSMLVNMLRYFRDSLSWNLSDEEDRKAREDYLNKLLSFMTRELTDYEREYIKDDYLSVDLEDD
jgi:predicted acetyltransferase